MAGPDGNVSGPGNVIAGFGAGVTESLLAVTPTESIKTQLQVVILLQVLLD
jgi:solute carrier family 25 (mitochondrial citrate transporter), member 1